MTQTTTDWRIVVSANTKAARSEIAALAKTARMAGMSMEEIFSNVDTPRVARNLGNVGRHLDKMNVSLQKGRVHIRDWNKYWQNSNNLIRHSKQLQGAHAITIEKTNGAMTSATAVMHKFNAANVTVGERLAYMNRFFHQASRNAINFTKNIQWSGRQIMVGFGVPFGIAMTGAAMAFMNFEEQVIRFRKVFNEEINELSIEDAEQRITSLANTMATSLGVSRNEIMETAATFAQMGLVTEDIEKLTSATTRLALLGEVPRETATSLLRAYNASEFAEVEGGVERIVNSLNALENSTSLTIQMMAANLPQIIPIFDQFNLKFGEGEAIVAGMVESLGNASEAVNALKVGLQRVYDPTKEAIDAFAEADIDLLGIRERNDEDVIGFFQELGTLMEDQIKTNTEFADTIGNLFGVRQAGRLATALRSVTKENSDFARGMAVTEKSVEELAATADKETRAITESFGSRLKQVKEEILISATEIGQDVVKFFMPMIEMVSKFMKWVSNLSDGAKRFALVSSLVVVGLSGILTAVGVLGQAFLYILRTFSAFLPKFAEWTEENLKAKIATDHVNEALRRQRTIVSDLPKIWETVEQAQRSAANATNTLTTAMERQNRVVSNSGRRATSRESLPINPALMAGQDPEYGGTSSLLVHSGRSKTTAPVGVLEAERDWLDRGAAREESMEGSSRRYVNSIVSSEGFITGGRKISPELQASRRRSDDLALKFRDRNKTMGQSSVKWRRGASGAGMAGMLAGGLMGGKTGNALMSAGMGAEALSLLASPKLMKGANNLAAKMALTAKSSGALKGSIARSGARLVGMLGSMGGIGLAAGAIAGSWLLISNRIKKAKEEAKLLSNEFENSAAISEELGMSTGELDINIGSRLTEKEIEGLSEEMKGLNEVIKNVEENSEYTEKEAGERIQGIFRNLARQWKAGGHTIDEINTALSELEAKLDVQIDEVDTGVLRQTLTDDLKAAIADASSQFRDESISWFMGGFNADNKQAMSNIAGTLLEAMENDPNNVASIAGEIEKGLERYTDFSQEERQEILDEIGNIMIDRIGGPMDLEGLMTRSEDFGTFLENLVDLDMSQETGYGIFSNDFWVEKKENAEAFARQLSVVNSFATGAGGFKGFDVLPDDADANDIARARQELDGLITSYIEVAKSMNSYQGELDGLSNSQVLANFEQYAELFGHTENNVHGVMAAMEALDGLQVTITIRENYVNDYDKLETRRFLNQREGAAAPPDTSVARDSWMKPLLESRKTKKEDKKGTEAQVKSYVSNFRSELDKRRDEVIDSILKSYDEATDRIIEKIEEQRDAEIASLEERKEAIKEYLEEQNKIQDALDDQISVTEAIVNGDYARAAQLQNASRFASIEDAAQEAIDGIDEEMDKTEEVYDLRIEREQEVRELQRKNLEESLDELRDMFLGSREAWNKFFNAATNKASRAGVAVEKQLSNGFNRAMQTVRRQMDLDVMWENAKFPNLERTIKDAVEGGMKSGADAGNRHIARTTPNVVEQATNRGLSRPKPLDGWHRVMLNRTQSGTSQGITNGLGGEKVLDGWMRSMKSATGSGILYGADEAARALDQYTQIRISSGGKATKAPSSFASKSLSAYHSGGPIGDGPPRDVPAILQTGEYVIQRSAVEALGLDTLEMLNNFHGGGVVSNMAKAKGKELLSGTFDPEPSAGADSGKPGWKNGIQQYVLDKFVPTLAALPGRQHVTSGYRSPAHNRRVGGSPNSYHVKGKALDFVDPENRSLSRLNQMGSFFQGKPGVKWVGMPKEDPSGGHNDHVHVSYWHKGGVVGKVGRSPKFKPPSAPTGSTNLGMSSSAVTLQIGEFHGTEENMQRLVKLVGDEIVKSQRKVNPSRRFS